MSAPRSIWIRLLAGLAAGSLLNLAFPPFSAGWVGFVALVPLWWGLRGASGRTGLLVGLFAGGAFFGLLLYWISYFGGVAWSALTLVMAASFALFGALGARLSATAAGRLMAMPALWVGVEMLRSRYPLGGFGWGALGYSQGPSSPQAGLAPIGGVFGLAIAVAAVNALVAEMLDARGGVARATALLAAAGIALAPAALPVGLAGAETGTLDVAAVQGNVPRDRFSSFGRRGGRRGAEDPTILQNHLTVTREIPVGGAPDLVVWPENALDRDPTVELSYLRAVGDEATRLRAPFLVGAIMDAGEKFANANLLIEPGGRIRERYDKVHLVPFGEYVPAKFFRRIVPVLDREIPIDGRPGERLQVFDTGAARVGPMICFESTYPEIGRALSRSGAQVLVVTTNNASFGTSPAARQHLAMSRMRALEHGKPVVHAAIAGISAIVMPDGTIVQRAGLFEPALLRARVPLTDGATPYTRYGTGIEIGIGAAAAAAALAGLMRRKPRAPDPGDRDAAEGALAAEEVA